MPAGRLGDPKKAAARQKQQYFAASADLWNVRIGDLEAARRAAGHLDLVRSCPSCQCAAAGVLDRTPKSAAISRASKSRKKGIGATT